jgi:hypothetical protein
MVSVGIRKSTGTSKKERIKNHLDYSGFFWITTLLIIPSSFWIKGRMEWAGYNCMENVYKI